MIAWCIILFHQCLSLLVLLLEVHTVQSIHHFTSFARNTSHTARLLINKVPPSLTRLLWQKSQNDFHWKVTEISSVFLCVH